MGFLGKLPAPDSGDRSAISSARPASIAIAAGYDRPLHKLLAVPKLEQLTCRSNAARSLLSQVLMGLGDRAGALNTHEESIEFRGGTSLVPDTIERFLVERLGREPGADLADARWVTDRHLDLKGARGSVVALRIHGIARPVPSGDRLPAFQNAIEARCAEGLVGGVLCFYDAKAGARDADRAARCGAADHPPRRTLPEVMIGGIGVIDRRGRLVWYATLFGIEEQD